MSTNIILQALTQVVLLTSSLGLLMQLFNQHTVFYFKTFNKKTFF
jgi:hypothetical protein